ncbi:MAG: hypothetical protein ACK4PI_10620 [Tepidisphaerales bacterium]
MRRASTLLASAAVLMSASLASAASVAFDFASNYVSPNPPWTNGSNGGFGFGAWQLTPSSNTGNAGFFLGNSAGNGSAPSGDINSAGVAFGLYANSGQTASAVRPFTGGPLAIGQIFSMSMDNGFIDNNGVVGFGLQTAGGTNVFEFYFRGGTSNYIMNIGGTEVTTPIPFTDDGLAVVFKLLSPTTFSFTVTDLQTTTLYTLGGTFSTPASIERLRLFNFNAGGGSQRDAYFNFLRITEAPPPPVEIPLPAASLMGMALLGGLVTRRR